MAPVLLLPLGQRVHIIHEKVFSSAKKQDYAHKGNLAATGCDHESIVKGMHSTTQWQNGWKKHKATNPLLSDNFEGFD